jgi:hypothetical protein
VSGQIEGKGQVRMKMGIAAAHFVAEMFVNIQETSSEQHMQLLSPTPETK